MNYGAVLAREAGELAYEGMRTPWGKADSISKLADGIYFVGTPGHGGVKLSRKLNAEVPAFMRQKGGWYEEDCDYSIVYVVFETSLLIAALGERKERTGQTALPCDPMTNADYTIRSITNREHINCFRNWKFTMYEQYFGVTLKEGESFCKDQDIFGK